MAMWEECLNIVNESEIDQIGSTNWKFCSAVKSMAAKNSPEPALAYRVNRKCNLRSGVNP